MSIDVERDIKILHMLRYSIIQQQQSLICCCCCLPQEGRRGEQEASWKERVCERARRQVVVDDGVLSIGEGVAKKDFAGGIKRGQCSIQSCNICDAGVFRCEQKPAGTITCQPSVVYGRACVCVCVCVCVVWVCN